MKVHELIAMLQALNPNDYVVLDLQDAVSEDLYEFYLDAVRVDSSSLEIRIVPIPWGK